LENRFNAQAKSAVTATHAREIQIPKTIVSVGDTST
jgi:hypothetical protein